MIFFKLFTKTTFFKDFSISKRNSCWYRCSEEVRHALSSKGPVVALESAIVTHGMKFPHNYEVALAVENIIRDQGAIPATIAVIKGKAVIGINKQELEELARNQNDCFKISRRDFPYVIGQGLSGGTTVSGTVIVAHKQGIPVFVTGGIGGVHREGQITMDVSADLTELGRTPVAVVCSGVKSILDIEKTLEYLETQGVAVTTYGAAKEFPAFYCKRSGCDSPYNLTSSAQAAKFIKTIFDMNLGSGALIAVPIPDEYSLDEKILEMAIDQGIDEGKRQNIKGKNITPFLLNSISHITGGKSLEANTALIKNNALIGANIAVELSKLTCDRETSLSESDIGFATFNKAWAACEGNRVKEEKKMEGFDVVVVGGTNLDFVVSIEGENFEICFELCNSILKNEKSNNERFTGKLLPGESV